MDGDGRDGGGGCKDAGSEDYENLPTSASLSTHMTAGAMAGILEHSVMYPVDSVKVRREETSGSGRAGRRARVHAFASRARAVRGSAPKARSPRAAAPRGSPGAGARSRGAAARAAQLLPPPGPPLPSPRGCPAGARRRPAGAPHGRSRRAPGRCCGRRRLRWRGRGSQGRRTNRAALHTYYAWPREPSDWGVPAGSALLRPARPLPGARREAPARGDRVAPAATRAPSGARSEKRGPGRPGRPGRVASAPWVFWGVAGFLLLLLIQRRPV